MESIDMKVNPSYLDEELVIAFTFEFQVSPAKIGEAVVFTYPCDQGNYNNRSAVIKEFNVKKEYEKDSWAKLKNFLKIIGVKPHT